LLVLPLQLGRRAWRSRAAGSRPGRSSLREKALCRSA
jgi:hypothetical protein